MQRSFCLSYLHSDFRQERQANRPILTVQHYILHVLRLRDLELHIPNHQNHFHYRFQYKLYACHRPKIPLHQMCIRDSLTGCTGKEPNEIAYVVALGIDSTDDDNYKITIQYANTTQISLSLIHIYSQLF